MLKLASIAEVASGPPISHQQAPSPADQPNPVACARLQLCPRPKSEARKSAGTEWPWTQPSTSHKREFVGQRAGPLAPHLRGLCLALAPCKLQRHEAPVSTGRCLVMCLLLASVPSLPHSPVVLPELFSQTAQTKTTTPIVYSQTPTFPEQPPLTLLLPTDLNSRPFLFTPSSVWGPSLPRAGETCSIYIHSGPAAALSAPLYPDGSRSSAGDDISPGQAVHAN